MKLLTYKIRPENPAEYSFDYMKQAQYIEALGPTELFRIPGTRPSYCLEPNWGDTKQPTTWKKPVAEEATPMESLVTSSPYLWYLTKFAKYMRLWLPYDAYSKFTMGLGVIAFGQGAAYFML